MVRFVFISAIFLLISLGKLNSVNAQDAAFPSEDSIGRWNFDLIPVEIKSIRVNEKAPFTVQNINDSAIKSFNLGQDIPSLLNLTPSTVVSSDAGAGIGYSSIRIRGTDINRINFTINGIPVNDAESQTVVFVNTPDLLSSTQSVQIQRGVGSSTHGSGAFGASVNLSNLGQGDTAYAAFDNTIGSFNTFKHTLRAGTGKLKGGFQFDVRLSKVTSDGYIERSNVDLKSLQFIAGWQSKDERTRVRFNMFTGIEKTGQAWNGMDSASMAQNRRSNTLGLKEDGTYYNDQTDNYQQDYYQLFFDHQFNDNWSLSLAGFLTRGVGFYNEYRLGQTYAEYGLNNYVQGGDTLTETSLTRRLWLDNYYYGGTFALNYSDKNTQVSWGGVSANYDGLHYGQVTWAGAGIPDMYKWYDVDAFKRDYSTYLKVEHHVGNQWYVFGDLQYRYVNYTINGFRKAPDIKSVNKFHFLNPKAGVSKIWYGANQSVTKAYFSVAIANKEPNRDDFEAGELQKPKHESLYNGELGLQWQKDKWNISGNLYYMHYHNQLIATGRINDVGAYTRFNVPESFRRGIELQADYKAAKWLNISANASFSQNKITSYTQYFDNYDDANGTQLSKEFTNSDIAFSPNFIAGGVITVKPFINQLKVSDFSISLIPKYVSKQYLDNTQNDHQSLPAFYTVDARLNYGFQIPNFLKANLIVGLNNIFNTAYVSSGYTFAYQYNQKFVAENYYYPQAMFNWLVGLQLSW